MNAKLKYATILSLAIAGSAFAEGDFSLTGNVQTQGTKAMYDNGTDDNLDGFWFRGNFGGAYKSDDFDGQITIRMYGAKFGNTVEVGSDKTSKIDKIQADIYWGNYKWALGDDKLNLKLGHWKTDWSRAGNFGTYVDAKLGTRGFLARDYSHDAFELGWGHDFSQLSVMLGAGDGNFDTGYLRAEEELNFTKAFNLGIAYRVNAIDPIANTAVLTHRITAKASYTILPKLSVYGEAAAIVTGKDDKLATADNAVAPEYAQDTKYYPFYVGVEIPTAKVLDNLYAEVEYIKDREDFQKDADDLAWTLGLVKKLGTRTKAQFNLYNEKKISDLAAGLRITTTIK